MNEPYEQLLISELEEVRAKLAAAEADLEQTKREYGVLQCDLADEVKGNCNLKSELSALRAFKEQQGNLNRADVDYKAAYENEFQMHKDTQAKLAEAELRIEQEIPSLQHSKAWLRNGLDEMEKKYKAAEAQIQSMKEDAKNAPHCPHCEKAQAELSALREAFDKFIEFINQCRATGPTDLRVVAGHGEMLRDKALAARGEEKP